MVIPAGTTPTLGAQFWDSAAVGYPGLNPEPGGTIGDITKAWVRFALTDASTSTAVGSATVQVADTVTLGDGIGSASVTSPFKSGADAVWQVTSSVVKDGTGAVPNLFYTAPADETGMIIFYVDTGQFATGGGTIGTGDQKSNFGFVARYKGSQPKGQVVFHFRGAYKGTDANFTVKSTALSGLAFSGASYPISSTLEGKCNIAIVDGKNNKLFSEGNWRFKATATDVDKGSGSDAFAITIWGKNNQLYRDVPATPLSGGNIVVHNPQDQVGGPVAGAARRQPDRARHTAHDASSALSAHVVSRQGRPRTGGTGEHESCATGGGPHRRSCRRPRAVGGDVGVRRLG